MEAGTEANVKKSVMKRIVASPILCAGSMLTVWSSAIAQEKENAPIVLEPTTYWNVDFGDEKCRLARAFGEGDDRHLLFIEQGGPSAGFGFMAIGPSFEKFRRPDRIEVRFGEFEPIKDRTPMLGETKGVGASLIYSKMIFEEPPERDEDKQDTTGEALPRLDVEIASAINSVSLRYGKRDVIFNTGNLGEAITVLNECSLNFVESWGLDRAAHASMTRLPKWKNELSVARRIQATYPSKALQREESAIIRMRVIVERDGTVSECTLNKATIAESLESPACREMKRATFDPALDEDGQPIRSFYITQIIYRINS